MILCCGIRSPTTKEHLPGDIKDHREGMRSPVLGMPARGVPTCLPLSSTNQTGTAPDNGAMVVMEPTVTVVSLSWASEGNSARLGNIERYFGGRNIAQISEQEQLQFLMHELKTSYLIPTVCS